MTLHSIFKHFTVLRKTFRILDWNSIFIACFLFITGCILAGISWRTEAPRIFVILYILLATTGFVFYYLRLRKESARSREETQSLLSPRTLKFVADQEHTKILMSWKALNTKDFNVLDEQCSTKSENGMKYNSRIHTILENVCEDKYTNNRITCIEDPSSRSVDPCSVQLVSKPVPGGNYSRKSENIESNSPPKEMPPSTSSSGKQMERSPTAKFYVPSPEIAHFTPEGPFSKDMPEVNVAQGTSSDSLTKYSEPIYENLDSLVSQNQDNTLNDCRGELYNPESKEYDFLYNEEIKSTESSIKLGDSLTKDETKTDSRYKSRSGTIEELDKNVKVSASSLERKQNKFESLEHSHPERSNHADVRKKGATKKYNELCSDVSNQNEQENMYDNLPSFKDARRKSNSDCLPEKMNQSECYLPVKDKTLSLSTTSNQDSYGNTEANPEKDGKLLKNFERNVYDVQLMDESPGMNISSAREQVTIENKSNYAECIISSDTKPLSDKSKETVAESEPIYENLPSYLHAVNSAINKKDKGKNERKQLINRNRKSHKLASPIKSSTDCAAEEKSNPRLHHNQSFNESVSLETSKFESTSNNTDMIHNLIANPGISKASNSSPSSVRIEITPSYHNLTYDIQTSSIGNRAGLEYAQKLEVSDADFDATNSSTSYENITYDIHMSPCENVKVEKEYLQKCAVIDSASVDITNTSSFSLLSVNKAQCSLQTPDKGEGEVNKTSLINQNDFGLQTNNLEERFRKALIISESQGISQLPQSELLQLPKKEECSNIVFKEEHEDKFGCFDSDLKKAESCLNLKKKTGNKFGSVCSPTVHNSEKLRKINFRISEKSDSDQFAKVTVKEHEKRCDSKSFNSSTSFSNAEHDFNSKRLFDGYREISNIPITSDAENTKFNLKQKEDLGNKCSPDDIKPSSFKLSSDKIFSKSLDCRQSPEVQVTGIESDFKAKCKISPTRKVNIDGSSKFVSFSSPLERSMLTAPRPLERKFLLTKSSSLPSEAASKSPTQAFLLPIATNTAIEGCPPSAISNVDTTTKAVIPHSKSMKNCDEVQLKLNPKKSNLHLLSLSQIFHDDSLSKETNLVDEEKVKSQFRRRETVSENNLSKSRTSFEKPIKHSPKQTKRLSTEGASKSNTFKRLSIEGACSANTSKRLSTEGAGNANTSKRLSIETLNVSQEEGMLNAETFLLESDFELKELRRRSITKSPGIFPPLEKVHSLSVPKTTQKSKYRQQLNNSGIENQLICRECRGRKSFDKNDGSSDSMHSPVTSRRVTSDVPSSQPISGTSMRKFPIRITGSDPDLVHTTVPSPNNYSNAISAQPPQENLPSTSESPKSRRKLSFEPSEDYQLKSLSKFHSLPLLSRRRLHLSPENCLPKSELKINKTQSSLQKQVTSPGTPKSATKTLGIESSEQCPPDAKSSLA